MAEDWLEVYENCADRLSNKLRLNKISILTFSQCNFKINRNQLELAVKATYGLRSNKFFETLNLTFWGRSLMTKRFGLHSNSRGAVEIKDLLISLDFRNRNTELLFLFRIISPCFEVSWKNEIRFAQKFLIWTELILLNYIWKKLKHQIKHIFMRPCFLTADLWSELYGSF